MFLSELFLASLISHLYLLICYIYVYYKVNECDNKIACVLFNMRKKAWRVIKIE